MIKKNTFSLLGLGNHAQKAIIPALNASKNADLVLFGSQRSYIKDTIAYENAATSSEVDAVYICLPNTLHATWCIKALQAGKNVICEKPIACSVQEAEEIIKNQKSTNKKLLEAFMYRYHPQHNIVKKLLREETIGKPKLFEAHFHYFLDDFDNIRMKKDLGGGSIFDVGCYLIDACLFLFDDKIKKIRGNWLVNQKSLVDEFANAVVEFESGMIANLTCGSRMSRQSSYAIFGETGKITVRDAFKIPKNKKGLILLETNQNRKQEIFSEAADHYQLMIDDFCNNEFFDSELILTRAKLIEAWQDSCLSI